MSSTVALENSTDEGDAVREKRCTDPPGARVGSGETPELPDGLSRTLIGLLDLDSDQERFLRSFERRFGRHALREQLKKGLNWSEIEPYSELVDNPDPT